MSETTREQNTRLAELHYQLISIIKKYSFYLFFDDVSTTDIADFIQSELSDNRWSIHRYLLTEVPSIQQCHTVIQLFHEMQRYSSIFDFSLWKTIVNKFATGTIKQELLSMERTIEQYCLATAVTDVKICEVPEYFQAMNIHLKLTPKYTTFHIIDELRKQCANRFNVPEAGFVLTSVEVGEDEVWLNLAVPQFSISDLRVSISQHVDFYSEESINSISLNDELIYVASKPNLTTTPSIVSIHESPPLTYPVIRSPSTDSQLSKF